jgi:phage baseplate assembly protein W
MAVNPITRISRSFKDISLSFEPHPVTKDLPILKNERAIIRSVRNIVETIPTERFFNPDFGSDVRSSLFGIIDFATASIIEDQIKTSITLYEPRVENVQVNVNPEYDDNALEVTVIFDIIGQDFPTQEFTFILEATR